MNREILVIIIIIVILLIILIFNNRENLDFYNKGKDQYTFSLDTIVKDVVSPTGVDFDDNGDMYITTKKGKLYKYSNGKLTVIEDFGELVDLETESEGGLMGIAIEKGSIPKTIYLSYTTKKDKGLDLVVSSFVLQNNKLVSSNEIVRINAPELYHHAGALRIFNGYLYLSIGDGGPQRDPNNHSQNMDLYLGKILKINLNNTDDIRILALGLRNPWQFSIDPKLGMFIGDVGQNTIESVYLLKNLNPSEPYNLGWNYYEGYSHPMDPQDKKPEDFTPPIFEYENGDKGRAIIGGFYLEDLGIYVFADYVGVVRAIKKVKDKWVQVGEKWLDKEGVLSLGFDGKNIYVLGRRTIYKLKVNKI